jgi:hypothetical protein
MSLITKGGTRVTKIKVQDVLPFRKGSKVRYLNHAANKVTQAAPSQFQN